MTSHLRPKGSGVNVPFLIQSSCRTVTAHNHVGYAIDVGGGWIRASSSAHLGGSMRFGTLLLVGALALAAVGCSDTADTTGSDAKPSQSTSGPDAGTSSSRKSTPASSRAGPRAAHRSGTARAAAGVVPGAEGRAQRRQPARRQRVGVPDRTWLGHRAARGGGAADARRHHPLPRAPRPGHQGDAAGGAVLRTARTWGLIDIFQSRPYACGWFGCIVDRAGSPKPPGRGPVSGPARNCVLGGVRRPSRPPHGRLRGCGLSTVSASCRAGCARW